MTPDALRLVGLEPGLVELLRLRRAALHQPDRDHGEEGELQILGLPVLRHRLSEVRRAHVAPEADRLFAVLELLLVVKAVAGDRLTHDRQQEDREEEQR